MQLLSCIFFFKDSGTGKLRHQCTHAFFTRRRIFLQVVGENEGDPENSPDLVKLNNS
ncbi:hypothetical protein BH23BAC1_BH23BAC1_33090 [soil metagenome]